MKIRIGTRKSPLALAQTELVADALRREFQNVDVEIVRIDTLGDKRLDIALSEIGGKGLFTLELEELLVKGDIDFAVHSAKDVPNKVDLPFKIIPVLERGRKEDVLIVKRGQPLSEVKKVGTSAVRRSEQLLLIGNFKIVPIRGNIGTRIRKMIGGECDALILASAGIDRLSEDEVKKLGVDIIEIGDVVPAPCQGILACEYISDDIGHVLKKLIRDSSYNYFFAEREFMNLLGGDCHTGVGIDIGKTQIKGYFNGRIKSVNIKGDIMSSVKELAEEFKV